MPRDYEVKLNRNTMTVMISTGLPRQSSRFEDFLICFMRINF